MKVILSSKYETYVLFAGFAILVAAVAIGSFYFGGVSATENAKTVSKQLYDQGFAEGQLYMETQCAREVVAVSNNCAKWTDPDMQFAHLNTSASR